MRSPTPVMAVDCSARATRPAASVALRPIGFSVSTCLPDRRIGGNTSACTLLGSATLIGVDGRVVEDTLKVGGGLGVSVAVGGPTSQLDIRIDDDREVDVDTLESGWPSIRCAIRRRGPDRPRPRRPGQPGSSAVLTSADSLPPLRCCGTFHKYWGCAGMCQQQFVSSLDVVANTLVLTILQDAAGDQRWSSVDATDRRAMPRMVLEDEKSWSDPHAICRLAGVRCPAGAQARIEQRHAAGSVWGFDAAHELVCGQPAHFGVVVVDGSQADVTGAGKLAVVISDHAEVSRYRQAHRLRMGHDDQRGVVVVGKNRGRGSAVLSSASAARRSPASLRSLTSTRM